MINHELQARRWVLEEEEKWREVSQKMPQISFPSDWKVTVIPPFAGAMARFLVELPCGAKKSIYADFYHRLGFYGAINSETLEPYWEVYPYCGDVGRCDIDDTEELLRMIADTRGNND